MPTFIFACILSQYLTQVSPLNWDGPDLSSTPWKGFLDKGGRDKDGTAQENGEPTLPYPDIANFASSSTHISLEDSTYQKPYDLPKPVKEPGPDRNVFVFAKAKAPQLTPVNRRSKFKQ